jgi:hypothetical protein
MEFSELTTMAEATHPVSLLEVLGHLATNLFNNTSIITANLFSASTKNFFLSRKNGCGAWLDSL